MLSSLLFAVHTGLTGRDSEPRNRFGFSTVRKDDGMTLYV